MSSKYGISPKRDYSIIYGENSRQKMKATRIGQDRKDYVITRVKVNHLSRARIFEILFYAKYETYISSRQVSKWLHEGIV